MRCTLFPSRLKWTHFKTIHSFWLRVEQLVGYNLRAFVKDSTTSEIFVVWQTADDWQQTVSLTRQNHKIHLTFLKKHKSQIQAKKITAICARFAFSSNISFWALSSSSSSSSSLILLSRRRFSSERADLKWHTLFQLSKKIGKFKKNCWSHLEVQQGLSLTGLVLLPEEA